MQKSSCSIGEIVPNINAIQNIWANMKTNSSGKKLCDFLISGMNERFADELNSEIYLVIFMYLMLFYLIKKYIYIYKLLS